MLNEDLYFVALIDEIKIYIVCYNLSSSLSGFSLPDPPRGRGQPLDGGLPARLRLQGEGGARRVPGLQEPGGHGQQQTHQLRGRSSPFYGKNDAFDDKFNRLSEA